MIIKIEDKNRIEQLFKVIEINKQAEEGVVLRSNKKENSIIKKQDSLKKNNILDKNNNNLKINKNENNLLLKNNILINDNSNQLLLDNNSKITKKKNQIIKYKDITNILKNRSFIPVFDKEDKNEVVSKYTIKYSLIQGSS